MITKKSKTGSTTVRRSIIAATFALSALLIPHSCVTYYTVVPQILPDGSMIQTVYAHADSARLAGDLSSNPFYFLPDSAWSTAVMERPEKEWFMEDSAVLNIYASRHCVAGSPTGTMQPGSEDYKGSPYLNPSEKWNRKRGFFFNTYEYSCRFSGLRDKMPVPIDSVMSEQEIHDWLTVPGNISGMNGVEIYNTLLSSLADKFSDWYNSCYIKVYCDLISEAAGDTLLSTAQRKEVSDRLMKSYDFIDDRLFDDNSVSKVASVMTDVTGNPAFVRAAVTHGQQLADTLDVIEATYIMPMTTALLYKVHMPGRLTYANTDIKDQGLPVWKVDGYRLLAGDVVIEATSRRVNPLGFIIIGLVIIAGAAFILRPRRY